MGTTKLHHLSSSVVSFSAFSYGPYRIERNKLCTKAQSSIHNYENCFSCILQCVNTSKYRSSPMHANRVENLGAVYLEFYGFNENDIDRKFMASCTRHKSYHCLNILLASKEECNNLVDIGNIDYISKPSFEAVCMIVKSTRHICDDCMAGIDIPMQNFTNAQSASKLLESGIHQVYYRRLPYFIKRDLIGTTCYWCKFAPIEICLLNMTKPTIDKLIIEASTTPSHMQTFKTSIISEGNSSMSVSFTKTMHSTEMIPIIFDSRDEFIDCIIALADSVPIFDISEKFLYLWIQHIDEFEDIPCGSQKFFQIRQFRIHMGSMTPLEKSSI